LRIAEVFCPINYQMQVRLDYTAPVQREIDFWGEKPISRIRIRRAPIMAFIEQFFGWITLGQWGEAKKRYGYDKFYHLSLILEYATAPGQTDTLSMDIGVMDAMPSRRQISLVVEKLELINVSRVLNTLPSAEFHEVDLRGRPITLGRMLNNARTRMGDQAFFTYDAFTNNCQVFVKNLLEGVGLLDQSAMQFLFQPVDKLLQELPSYTQKVASFITTLGGVFNGVVNGYSNTNNQMIR